MACEGQNLNIQTNQPLFSIIGTTYGGNGVITFALPDLRGRVPIHADFQNYSLGERAGEQAHTLTVAEMPPHAHAIMRKTTAATSPSPAQNVPALPAATVGDVYGNAGWATPMAANSMQAAGSTAPHNNMQPYLALTFIICVNGDFPSQF